jgi:hypothetical protein
MDVASQHSIAWYNARHVPPWCICWDYGSVENYSRSIIGIIFHQVLSHLSVHGTSTIRKHFQPKVHNTKFKELTESEIPELTSSMDNYTEWAILT